ncbi:hypothetical protein HNP52_004006 [Sphingomonas kyeonggiensis]|uniref:DUF1097 domain-containing protein n=1 Tax=Sphingomonas kyeonggiensis TaxID=1268553 RepID=A0A7W7K4J4_9SPHN|nr:DUF1097 domain-containing protein [Sphingomonas kyeonggiensis]MBB4840909.1 hypothetical protein [Sphingomonas kyeonggiensis]
MLTTLIASAAAALASAGSLVLALPVWAMFIGLIAFYTRVLDTRSAIENLACTGIGLATGVVASVALAHVGLSTGIMIALPAVVFAVAILVVSLRGLPMLNNVPAYFLGLVAWFAGHLEPSLESVAELFGANAIGVIAGWVSFKVPAWLSARAKA